MRRILPCSLVLWSMTVAGQSWHIYLTSSTVYDIDISGNNVLVGLDQRVATVNTTTLEAQLLTPPASTFGGEVDPVRQVAIDSSGAYWAAIANHGNGLFRYANGAWTQFLENNSPVPSDLPSQLYADRLHNVLWSDFDGSTKGTFDGTTFNSLGFHPGPSVATSTGDLWIANSQGGLDRYDGLTITVYDTANSGLPQQTVDHLTADPNDRLWFSMYATDTVMWTTQYTIGTFDGTSWQEYTADNSALPLITEQVKDLGIDTNGTLVIATRRGLIEFDGVNAVEYSHALGNFPDVIVNALAIGADGTRWIGTQLDGLLRMHNGMVTSVDLGDDPLTGNRVYTVLVDQQNRVWAGTEHHDNSYSDRGLVMIDDTTWTVWSETQGDVPGSAHAIELDPFGNVFIAGQDGVYKYVADAWENYNASGGAAFMNTDMALAADGTAWVQNYYFTGLERCDGSSTVNVTTPIGGSHLHCVELDGQGNLWVGGQHALARMDPLGAWMVYDDQNALPLMGTINDIEFDTNGELWVAADDLLHFDGSTWTAIPHPVIGSGWMDDLEIEPSGVIWVALGPYGLGRYDGSWMYWDHTNSPIITDYVVEISLDPTRHRIWGATYGGGLFYMEDDDLVMGLPGRTASRASGQLELSPVPANDHVTVRTTGIDVGEKLIRVCSVSGAILRTSVFTGPSTTIDVSALATGVYEVSVQGKEGMQHGRLVVE